MWESYQYTITCRTSNNSNNLGRGATSMMTIHLIYKSATVLPTIVGIQARGEYVW